MQPAARRATSKKPAPASSSSAAASYYVLTNRHVIKYSTLTGINIKLADGRQLHPTQVWADRPPTSPSWRSTPRSSSPPGSATATQLEIGDFVLAVGSPFGLSHSVTYGIISAKGRRDLELGDDGVSSRTSCRPMPPSTPATAAARCSTSAAK